MDSNEFSGNLDEASLYYNSDVTAHLSDVLHLSLWRWCSLFTFKLLKFNFLVDRCGDGDTAPTLTDNGTGGNDGTMHKLFNF